MSDDLNKDIEVIDDEEEEQERGFKVSDSFGILLKYYRTRVKGLSLKELEELSGVSASYVHRLERGIRKSPSISKILQIAEALQIPNSVLVATIIKETKSQHHISLSEILIQNDYLLNGGYLNKEAKECLLRINEFVADCQWSPNSKVRELYQLSELIDDFKQAL